jgi:broad specificity phosphatase PhoE
MKEKIETYANRKVENPDWENAEDNINIPVIDIVRHGETDYKELLDPDFKFNPRGESFKLDEEHLDLNSEGIRNILRTAEKMEQRIDKEKEVIMFVTSPNFRAESSMLLIKDHFEKSGITTIDKYLRAENLRQIKIRSGKDEGKLKVKDWMSEHKKFISQDETNAKLPPEIVHHTLIEKLGMEWEDLFREDYPDIDKRFERFLRHMINIRMHFSEKTREELKGKRLRIIALTHEELPSRFVRKVFGDNIGLQKAQNFELVPDRHLHQAGMTRVKADLHPKGEEGEVQKAFVVKEFD